MAALDEVAAAAGEVDADTDVAPRIRRGSAAASARKTRADCGYCSAVTEAQ
ncbi:hypothetical protein BN973_04495 [Mycobacterium triplex]|uniref:Uncharacterized protein n=1 Tax=Mycobacterium triplex TaxID=47839 RepID=A0A024K3F9_9MYCO|nr:hypothetical protein [Mycobacterium triplex]CDO90102.1 hypothetical protein BN973_04495 [Mycobacterium triplex]